MLVKSILHDHGGINLQHSSDPVLHWLAGGGGGVPVRGRTVAAARVEMAKMVAMRANMFERSWCFRIEASELKI